MAIAREGYMTVHDATFASLAETLSAYLITADAHFTECLASAAVCLLREIENNVW